MSKIRLVLPKPLLFCSFFFLLNTMAMFGQAPPRVTEAVDNSQRLTLAGNVHSLARAEFDRGAAPLDLPLERMLLVLQRSPAQEIELEKLLSDQQDKSSPRYHQWLTPQQFGQRFGPADSDIREVTAWLQGNGFHDIRLSKGRAVIEFSGTAAQVEAALGTGIRKFVVRGEEHWANAGDPQIPVALAPVVAGVFTLHNFYKKPLSQVAENQITAKAVRGARPEFTSTTGQHALGPADYYTIYNFNPLQIFTAAKIAIVGRSNINLQDVDQFHSLMNDQASSPQVIVNGPDPGNLGGGEEGEAVLDTTWAGAVAPTAFLSLVVSKSTTTTDGIDLSELYIIDNNLADVMSESFGDCEAHFTSTQAAGIASLAQQAAAQGITYVVAAGDSGSAGCDNQQTQTVATHPVSVNMLAATPYTVAVGGTTFNEHGSDSTYWRFTNAQGTLESAISYIPEDTWNRSCSAGQSGCSQPNIWAGGGGASTFFKKPSWQAGVAGIPADNARDLPDVSLTAASHDPYLLCLRASCVPDAQGRIFFAGVSGTSAAAPAFAGIMALVGQKAGLVRLGQPNFVLYRLAAMENFAPCNASSTTLPASTCVFNDVTVGTNAVPGEAGYGTPSATYPSGTGYDLATGLGSVNVTNLINQWNTVTFSPTNTTFSISPVTAVHGSPLNVTVNVAPNSGTGIPSGAVWLSQSGYPHGNFVGDSTADVFTLDAQGSFAGVTHLLPGGTYQVGAHYAGDGTYAASDATPPVQVTIQAEPTTITFSVLTTDASGNFIPFTNGPFGTPVYLQAQVSWQSGYGTPSANVNFYDTNGSSAGGASVDAKGNALSLPAQFPAGTHSITAAYVGDNSFSSSSNLTPINFAITQVATAASLKSQQTAQSLMLTATVSASGMGSPPTGMITFSNGSTVLGTAFLTMGSTSNGTAQATAAFDGSQLAPGQYNVTASYPGDTNYTASISAPVALNLVADFSVSAQANTPQTVPAGVTAMFVNYILVTGFFGFSSPVIASCSSPAPGSTCKVTPASLQPVAGLNFATVSVTTMGPSLGVVGMPTDPSPFRPPLWSGMLVALWLCALMFRLARARQHRLIAALTLSVLLLFVAIGQGGCGGGGGSSGSPQTRSGTPAGTYPVTVTATSGTITHTATLTLIVQ